jgi:hypothetical protein
MTESELKSRTPPLAWRALRETARKRAAYPDMI